MRRGFILIGLVAALALSAIPAQAADVDEINRAIAEKGLDWIAVPTRVGDLPDAEKRCLAGIPEGYEPHPGDVIFDMSTDDPKAPTSLDWRSYDGGNWTTPARNQLYCGSCAAFAAIGALEALLNIEAGSTSLDPNLSEQHLFSCGGGRCEYGMYPEDAFDYLKSSGVPDESCFPYASGQDGNDRSCSQTCDNWRDRAEKISDWQWYASSSSIKQALTNGPMSTFMDIYEDFYYYGGGIYSRAWGSYLGSHGVTLVGYNDNQGYWIIKNSWGSDWGEGGGFGRIAYNQVGLADYAARLYVSGGSSDDDSAGRDCPDICNKLVTCDHMDGYDDCLRQCYDIRSTIAECLEDAHNCGDVDYCVESDDEDQTELCQNICEKLYACDLIEASEAQRCLDSCLEDFSGSAKDCLTRASDCGDVEACAGMDGDGASDDDDDNSNAFCGFTPAGNLDPAAALLAVTLAFFGLRSRKSRNSRSA